MSIQLDFRTLSLTLMLFSLVFALGMFAYSKEHAKFTGLNTMGVGYLLVGAGCMLLGLRGFIHDAASIVVANIVIIVGLLLINRGLFKFIGITLRYERRLSLIIVVLFSLVMTIYTFYEANVNVCIQCFSLTFAVVCFIGATGLLQHSEFHSRMAANLLIAMFLLVGAFFMFRLLWTFFEVSPDNFMNTGLLSALAIIAGEFLVILSSFSTIWMASDELQHELSEIARVDPLTGAYNRRAFDEYCDVELSRAVRSSSSFAIIMCDLDHFKKVND